MHVDVRARHSLAMHFATFAGSDVEALDPIVELEKAKREMAVLSLSVGAEAYANGVGGSADDSADVDDVQRTTTTPAAVAVEVGDWWMEGGMGVIDVGETAVVHVGGESQSVGAFERAYTVE